MTLVALREAPATTEDRARELSTAITPVITPPTGRITAHEFDLILYTGGTVWIVDFKTASATLSILDIQTQVRQYSTTAGRIAALWEDVDQMVNLYPDWNGYGSEPPNEFSREVAKQILLSTTNIIVPNHVAASAQGGVGICFYRGERYADIECLNTGEILATVSDGTGRPQVWEVKPTESTGALKRIGQYIAS